METKARVRSPLRYPGGKGKMAEMIILYFPDPMPEFVVSGFMGGGGLELALCQRGIDVVSCDLEAGVASFWMVAIKDGSGERIAQGAWEYYLRMAASKQDAEVWFNSVRTEYREIASAERLSIDDRYKLAALFYVVNRVSRDGIFTSGSLASDSQYRASDTRSWLPRFQPSNIEFLKAFKPPKNLKVYHSDYALLLQEYGGDFFYGDPPYYGNGDCKLYGNDGQLHSGFNHERLKRYLEQSGGNWLLSYDIAAVSLYPEYPMSFIEMSKSIGKNKAKKKELLIRNYQ